MRIRFLTPGIVLALAAPAQADWRQASTDHFVIYSEDSASTLKEFATKLERYDAAIRSVRNLPDEKPSPSNRLTVFVVSSMAKVQKLYGKGGESIGGFYTGRATGSVAITPRLGGGSGEGTQEQIVLLHEYAHHLMFQTYPGAFPAWLIEGFAEFHSTAKFEKDGSVGLGLPANHRAYGLLMAKPLKIEKLLTASVGELNVEERDVLYGRGWLLTHYLTFEPSRKGQLSTYLLEMNKGVSSLDAARKAFGDLAKLDKDLDAYVRQRRLTYFKLSADKISIGKIELRELTPAEDAVMDVRIRSKRGVDEAEAKALVPLARKAAAPHPKDVLAQTTLAEAEYDAGNYAEAEAAADRALATDPKAVEALIYKGRAKMAIAAAAKKSDDATWKEVRKWFLVANRVEPEDPEPLLLYYQSFGEARQRATANAASGLVYALQLAPQDMGLRMMVAHQHLVDGKAADARAALGPIAYSPHGGKMAEFASAIIAKIDAGGAKAALQASEEAASAEEGAGSGANPGAPR